MPLPIVTLRGTPYEQGVQHGRQLKERIEHNLAVYFERFERELGLTRDEVLSRAARYAQAIEWQSPAYFDGMRGIARGAAVDEAAIAALNVRYELFYYQDGVNAHADGCTAFAVLPAAAADGRLWLCENWDWIAHVKGAVVRSIDPDGFAILAFTEAGIFGGKIGLNAAGLGLAISGLTTTDDDWARLQRPFHLRCYEILHSRDLDTARRVISDSNRSCSANFLIVQAPDQVINIEAAPHISDSSAGNQACVVHTNHFIDPAALGVVEPEIEDSPHSYHRYDRSYQLLAEHEPLTLDDLKTVLRDHAEFPYSVCFHIDPAMPPEEHYLTLTSVIMDVAAGTMLISDGPPCESPYDLVSLV